MALVIGTKWAKKLDDQIIEKQKRQFEQRLSKPEIGSIRDWLTHQPHLPALTDEAIIRFLHSNYYSIERTKDNIDNYFTIRTHAPDLFCNRHPTKDVSSGFKAAHFCLIPPEYKTPDGYRVAFGRLGDTDVSKFNFSEVLRASVAFFDYGLAEDPLSDGFRLVLDMKHVQLGHLARINLPLLKKFMLYVQDGIPVRLKSIHVINTFSIINQIMAIVKPLMKAEFFELLRFHSASEFDDFCAKYVPKYMIPSDYDGQLESFAKHNAALMKTLNSLSDWLKHIESAIVNEKLRPERAKSSGDVFGLEGSFKKLELD